MKTKKTLLALAFVSAGLVAVPAAFAQNASADNGGWFINGNVGRTAIDHGPYDDHDTGYALNAGYRWSLAPKFALGAEVGYNDLGNIRAKNIFNGDPVVARTKSQLHGWTVGANARLDMTPSWYLSGRAGLYSWSGHGLSNDVNPIRKSLDDNSWYAGAGIGYNVTPQLSVGVNYDYFDASKNHVDLSTDMVSASVEYRF
ncbi:porin family protein [Rhodanobacter lindaniclasticus]